jgi:hypothetical protein
MAEPAPQSNVETDEQQVTAEESGDIDSLLPTENLIAKESVARRLAKRQQQDAKNKKRDWAHEINANEPFENFHELVPEMAHDVSAISFGEFPDRDVDNPRFTVPFRVG